MALPTTFLFSHGMWGNKRNAEWYAPNEKSPWFLITGPYYTFDYPDVGAQKGEVIKGKVNVGQELDMQALIKAYNEILLSKAFNNPQEGMVIIGSSRGAVTALNLAATKPLPRLRALIAEAPADNVLHVLDYQLSKYYMNWGFLTDLAEYLLSKYYYTGYTREGINPIAVVENISKDLPILLVHSKDDDFVATNSSRLLYLKLRESGHPNVYLLELDHGLHGKYNLGVSARIYQTAVNAFYKKYHIPYDPLLAAEGEKYLAQSQPSVEAVTKLLGKKAPSTVKLEKSEL
jgi:predicted esterase